MIQVSDEFLPQAAKKFSLNDAITTAPPYAISDLILSVLFSCDKSIDVSHHDIFTDITQLLQPFSDSVVELIAQ